MKIYQFGKENQKIFVMFECTAEPWWVFKDSCSLLAKDYRVLLFIADGHDELGTTFVSLEKNVRDAANWLRKQNITYIDAMYGVSMGGASVIRFLATEDIPVKKAIIDAGITPYPYPKPICRMIAIWDFLSINLVTKNYQMMKTVAPPERWTPKNEDPEEHYRKIFEFEKNHYSPATIYNVFWTTNNYSMPEPMPIIDTKIEYWYGEKEKRARKNDIKYTCKVYPQTVVKEFKGLAHAELVLMHPQRFYEEVKRFLEEEDD